MLPPLDEQYGTCSSYEERRALFETLTAGLHHPALLATLAAIGADDRNKSRGHFHELWEAYNRSNEHGDEVVATQLMIDVPGLGKTDIDVLTADGRWLEIKRYKRTLTLHDLKRKLDVLGEALRRKIVISVAGRDVPVRQIELHALKTVAEPAKKYARERGIVVYEYSVYPLRPPAESVGLHGPGSGE